MNRLPLRATLTVLGVALLALGLAACGSSEDAPAGAKKLSFKITDAGCLPHDAAAPAGPITFEADTDGSSSAPEIEVLDGETILGEKENLTDGLSGSFSLTLEEGEYTVRCNGGSEEDGTLKVTGQLETTTSPAVQKAIDDYKEYLLENSTELTELTKPF